MNFLQDSLATVPLVSLPKLVMCPRCRSRKRTDPRCPVCLGRGDVWRQTAEDYEKRRLQ